MSLMARLIQEVAVGVQVQDIVLQVVLRVVGEVGWLCSDTEVIK